MNTKQSILAESKVITRFIELDYDVFIQFSGKEPFDLAVHKNGTLYRVNVKSTSQSRWEGSYCVELKRVRSNKKNNALHVFDPEECDILAVYVQPMDAIVFLNPKDVGRRGSINLTTVKRDTRSWVIGDYQTPWFEAA